MESVPHARLKALQKFKGLPCSLKGLVKFTEVVRIFEMEGRESERERGERERERSDYITKVTAMMQQQEAKIQLSCSGVDNPWTTAQEGFY